MHQALCLPYTLVAARMPDVKAVQNQTIIKPVFRCKNQNSKKNFRHLHGDLNLNEIKNALRLLTVNRETNLMNLIRL